MQESVPGLVLAFHDGEVSSGVQNVKGYFTARAYGAADVDATIYYNVAGTLVKPRVEVVQSYSADDWILLEYQFFIDKVTQVPFYSFILRIDGRA